MEIEAKMKISYEDISWLPKDFYQLENIISTIWLGKFNVMENVSLNFIKYLFSFLITYDRVRLCSSLSEAEK